jgi:hypothetical protein
MRARRYSVLLVLIAAALFAYGQAAYAEQSVSVAENRLFLADHLGGLPDNTVLSYAYAKAGSRKS